MKRESEGKSHCKEVNQKRLIRTGSSMLCRCLCITNIYHSHTDYGQLGIEQSQPRLLPGAVASPLTDLPVIAVSCGYYHTIVLTATHSLFSFGRNDYGVSDLDGWVGR